MPEKDYYKILGVEKSATKEEIKKAYKRLAKKLHPDLNPEHGDAEKFKEINEAAAVLGDDQKRQRYDQFGAAGPQMGQGFGGGVRPEDFAEFNFDFDSIFDNLFGGGFRSGGRRGPMRGSDLRFDLSIDLKEAYSGTRKTIIVPKLETCDNCDGKGAEKPSDIERCPACQGTGMQKNVRRTPFGMFATTTTCSKCHSEGEIIREPCPDCHGTGRVEIRKKIEIRIPAGVEDNMRLRVASEGEAGEKGASSGDLFVVVHINENELFERHGNDIYLEVPLSFGQAALGDDVVVPTLDGEAKLKIPAGTQTDTIFRMKGKGIPDIEGGGSGSQLVKVIVQVPKKISKKQKELIKELEKGLKKKKGFFEF